MSVTPGARTPIVRQDLPAMLTDAGLRALVSYSRWAISSMGVEVIGHGPGYVLLGEYRWSVDRQLWILHEEAPR